MPSRVWPRGLGSKERGLGGELGAHRTVSKGQNPVVGGSGSGLAVHTRTVGVGSGAAASPGAVFSLGGAATLN